MAPKNKPGPVGEVTGIIVPVAVLLFVIVAALWLVTKTNEAIPIEIWNLGSGVIIGGLAVLIVVYQKYF